MAFNTEWRMVDNYNGYGGTWCVLGMSEIAFRVEDDGTISNLFLAAAAPQGGLPRGVSNYPALLRGPRGYAPSFVKGSNIEIAHDDPTETGFDINLIAEETEVSGPVWELNLIQRAGAPGADGEAILDPTDYGTPAFGQNLTVAAGATTFELTYPKVGGLHLPTSISSAPDGSTAEVTMAVVDIAAGVYNFDWTPSLRGNAVCIGSSSDVQVDLIVRRDDETGGNIIGRGCGVAGQKYQQPNLISKVEAGTNVVNAGEACTLYFRTKKMSGSATYGAANTTAAFEMQVVPVP